MELEFKPMPQTKGRIWVGNDGQVIVFTKHSFYYAPPQIDFNNNSLRVTLFVNKRTRNFCLHRLVWRVFKGEIPDGHFVLHKDGNKHNCRLDNLYTSEKRPPNKITPEKLATILESELPPKKLAERLGIHPNTVRYYRKRAA